MGLSDDKAIYMRSRLLGIYTYRTVHTMHVKTIPSLTDSFSLKGTTDNMPLTRPVTPQPNYDKLLNRSVWYCTMQHVSHILPSASWLCLSQYRRRVRVNYHDNTKITENGTYSLLCICSSTSSVRPVSVSERGVRPKSRPDTTSKGQSSVYVSCAYSLHVVNNLTWYH